MAQQPFNLFCAMMTIVSPQLDKKQFEDISSRNEALTFELLVARHRDRLMATIVNIVKDEALAEDILQETFIKALMTLRKGKYQEEGKFVAWVSRIAYNLAIDHFRKNKRYPTGPIEGNEDFENDLAFCEESIEEQQIQEERIQKLHALIETLPPAQQEVVKMRHFQNMSFQEIAQATNVSINTALGRMRYALINLRKQIDKHNIQLA
ncbi:RNA polymerase sigma factor [Thermonema sp.]|uniref:RNA polymerase sigma factor n=1 Tax=Thermonema sp. TaxID=2231181 RepID=UPI00258DA5CC|nr:sigma-70 family RNA polymerase sigma factor [Thermonema sp.]